MKTLIVYASRYGATEVCAKYIAKSLKGNVEVVDLNDTKEFNLTSYDKIIIGSPVYAGMVVKSVKKFYQANKEVLKAKKTAVFLSCMEDKALDQYIDNGFSETFRNSLVAKTGCGGIFNFEKMNFIEKFIIKKITTSRQKNMENPMPVDLSMNVDMLSDEKMKKFAEAVNLA